MSIKTRKFSIFFLTAGLLIAGVTWQAVKAQEPKQINCNKKLSSGINYKLHQQGQFQQGSTLSLSGEIKITKTYQCPQGTCFRADMKIYDYDLGPKSVEGYWQGSSIQFVRYVGQENTQENWSGQCLENAVKGQWYFPNNLNKTHPFRIDLS